MKSTAVIVALFASVAGTAANAEPKAPTPPAAELTAPAPTVTPDQRYCVQSDVTGSRIARRECHTLAQWQHLNVDVLALVKR